MGSRSPDAGPGIESLEVGGDEVPARLAAVADVGKPVVETWHSRFLPPATRGRLDENALVAEDLFGVNKGLPPALALTWVNAAGSFTRRLAIEYARPRDKEMLG